MQTQNRLFDDLARVAGGALGALSGVREEVELLVRGRIERVLSEMDLVPRDEFDAVKAMAEKARSDNETLLARVAELEMRLNGRGKTKAAASSASITTRRRPPRRVTLTVAPVKSAAAPGDTAEATPSEASGSAKDAPSDSDPQI